MMMTLVVLLLVFLFFDLFCVFVVACVRMITFVYTFCEPSFDVAGQSCRLCMHALEKLLA
jgi:hypothetical protein